MIVVLNDNRNDLAAVSIEWDIDEGNCFSPCEELIAITLWWF